VALLALLVQRVGAWPSVAGALVAALAERAGARGIDNLAMPVLTAAALTVWR
jgi:dolichol kinase